MTAVAFKRVNIAPSVLQSGAIYFQAKGANSADLFIADASGTRRDIVTDALINNLITAQIADINQIDHSATYATMTSKTRTKNRLVLCADASGDSTVSSGSAMYFYEHLASSHKYKKVAEFESMDLSLTWAALEGKPTSAVADIDDAVGKKHIHLNTVQLSKIGEDASGNMTFSGQVVGSIWAQEDF
jgi:hypothetical protein